MTSTSDRVLLGYVVRMPGGDGYVYSTGYSATGDRRLAAVFATREDALDDIRGSGPTCREHARVVARYRKRPAPSASSEATPPHPAQDSPLSEAETLRRERDEARVDRAEARADRDDYHERVCRALWPDETEGYDDVLCEDVVKGIETLRDALEHERDRTDKAEAELAKVREERDACGEAEDPRRAGARRPA